jgi:hypothetical protein
MALSCIIWHSAAFPGNRTIVPRRHITRLVELTKTTTFTYEIQHLDTLTQSLLLSIIANTIFPHTLHEKCSEL